MDSFVHSPPHDVLNNPGFMTLSLSGCAGPDGYPIFVVGFLTCSRKTPPQPKFMYQRLETERAPQTRWESEYPWWNYVATRCNWVNRITGALMYTETGIMYATGESSSVPCFYRYPGTLLRRSRNFVTTAHSFHSCFQQLVHEAGLARQTFIIITDMPKHRGAVRGRSNTPAPAVHQFHALVITNTWAPLKIILFCSSEFTQGPWTHHSSTFGWVVPRYDTIPVNGRLFVLISYMIQKYGFLASGLLDSSGYF